MFQLPQEIAGNIYSKVTPSMELKFVNKAAMDVARYQTHIKGRINLKSLFIKNKTGVIVPFYYNLKSLIGIVIVNTKEDLKYVSLLINKLNSITIEYNGGSIEDTFILNESFVNSNCEYMKIFTNDDTYYTLERRNELIVAYIDLVVGSNNIAEYLEGVDSLLVAYMEDHILELIQQNEIQILHVNGISANTIVALRLIHSVYITSEFNYFGLNFIEETQPLTNITYIEFDDILISDEESEINSLIYKIFSNISPMR